MSALDFPWRSPNPPTSSLASLNGPSMTDDFLAAYRTRTPFELDARPSPPSITPDLMSSSLNVPISVSIFSSGIMPASDFSLLLTITMNRIVVAPCLGSKQGRLRFPFEAETLVLFPRRSKGTQIDTAGDFFCSFVRGPGGKVKRPDPRDRQRGALCFGAAKCPKIKRPLLRPRAGGRPELLRAATARARPGPPRCPDRGARV